MASEGREGKEGEGVVTNGFVCVCVFEKARGKGKKKKTEKKGKEGKV